MQFARNQRIRKRARAQLGLPPTRAQTTSSCVTKSMMVGSQMTCTRCLKHFIDAIIKHNIFFTTMSLACAGLKSLPEGLEQFDMLTYLFVAFYHITAVEHAIL